MSMPALQSEPSGLFQLIRRLGGGGFAEVLLAKDCRPHNYGAFVAIKRLRPGLIHRDPVFLDSLLFEAELGMMLSDAHVRRVDSVIEHEGEPAIVMEYVEGVRLDRLLLLEAGRGLPPEAASEIVRQVCEGLVAIHNAHDAGGNAMRVVHQDIKPANLIVTKRGVAKILDLGMARPQRQDVVPLWVRQGTPGYRSPEQARGEPVLSGASDLYAVGILLFELLTGTRLFGDRERDLDRLVERQRQLSNQLHVVAARIAPPGLDLILERLLAFDPKDRYANAYEVIKDLAHWQWTWNNQFDLVEFMTEVGPRLAGLPDERRDAESIHNSNTEPGVRLETLAPPPLADDLPSGEAVGAVTFAPFDGPRPERPRESVTPPSPVRDPAPGAFASARQLFRRLAGPFSGR